MPEKESNDDSHSTQKQKVINQKSANQQEMTKIG